MTGDKSRWETQSGASNRIMTGRSCMAMDTRSMADIADRISTISGEISALRRWCEGNDRFVVKREQYPSRRVDPGKDRLEVVEKRFWFHKLDTIARHDGADCCFSSRISISAPTMPEAQPKILWIFTTLCRDSIRCTRSATGIVTA